MKELIQDISEFVQIPTLYEATTTTEEMPYGRKVDQGYQWMKEKAQRDGFEVLEYDGHALAIRIKGQTGRKRIDIASHMDVVAPGDGWEQDPFSGLITEEYIYGRGTVDMKSALMITYHVLRQIKESNVPLNNEIRIVLGCDEERTMEDLKYYIAKTGAPDFAFTPDGRFPYSLGEKGALMWTLEGSMATCIEELEGGVQCNVVSPTARAVMKDTSRAAEYQEWILRKQYDAVIHEENGRLVISMQGKAAHASVPEQGRNATVQLLELVAAVSEDKLAQLLYLCFADPCGKGAGLDYETTQMGKLTINLGVLSISEGKVFAQVDCRYPKGITSDILTQKLAKALAPISVTLSYDEGPTLSDQDSPYLQILLDTYRNISKDLETEPFISGGVTYSKVIPNCVAFGPMRPSDLPLAHQANERIEISNLLLLYEIYKETILRLGTVEL